MTVAFEDSLSFFSSSRSIVRWTGNPVRDLEPTTDSFHIDPTVPTVFIFGGGTGAQGMNALVTEQLADRCNVIHMTGGRTDTMRPIHHRRYMARDFLTAEMTEALAKADVVVCRAGIGTISELAALGKPAIVIPMPQSHQEVNGTFLRHHQAAVVLEQAQLTPEAFTQAIMALIENTAQQQTLSAAISKLHKPEAARAWADLIEEVIL
jgi:UDP-N-acetylglucosamine--N-acetylmuramyl-(pentapeptide) pyrophosphoryl-undecaprenol N-acetylglucosamine transferase